MYESFALVYDLFMENIPYEKWGGNLLEVLKKNKIEDGLILDLGCGTGVMTRFLRDAGYDMIGIDLSEDMLLAAREEDTDGILYLCQDMREFELFGTVRAIVSVCDCLNYILDEKELAQVFKLANNYLDPGGLFIWDMSTNVKYEGIGSSTIAENRDDAAFIWDNEYDKDTHINTYELTLFIKDEESDEDVFFRDSEVHTQRAYSIEEVKAAVLAGGMEFVSVVDADTMSEPTDSTERLLFVAREKYVEGKKYV